MTNYNKTLTAIALALAVTPFGAANADETASFEVRLVIEGACTISATTLNFGTNSGSIVAAIDNESALTVNCTNGTAYAVAMNNGVGTGASAAARKMTNAGDSSTVDYSLYTDTGRSTVWSDTSTASGTGNGADQNIPVYGRVAAGQTAVSVGDYVDTVVATITF